MVAPSPDPMYEIRQIPGNGKGLVARRNINRGERIIAENPLFTFPNINDTMPTRQVIGPKVLALPADQQRTFYGLYNNFIYFGTTASIGIIKTNALPVDNDTDAVFPTFSLSNHSCLPKASYSWNGDIMQGTLHATRNISAGNEITIAYGDHRRGLVGRFVCICELCSIADRNRLAKSDDRRENMVLLEGLIWRWTGPPREPEEVFRLCYELEYLMIEEYESLPSPMLAELYEFAAGIAATNSDAGRTIAFARWAHSVRCICEGDDNPKTQRCATRMQDARVHPRWGRTDLWSAQLQIPPMHLSIQDYAAWIWRWGR